MTTLTTYAELKQNIQDFGKRADMLSKLDLFIDLCESDIRRQLRVTEMDASATASTSTSVRYVAIPTRCAEIRQILITIDGIQYEMDFKNINDMAIRDSAGVPCQYSVTNRIELDCVSDQAYTLTIQYYQYPEPLSGAATSNSVLLSYPMVYLAGCMRHFSTWAKMGGDALSWAAVFADEVAKANGESSRRRFPSGLQTRIHGGMVV